MKNFITYLFVWALIGFSASAQTVLFSENFNSYNGFGDAVLGWKGGSFGFRVYIGHGEGISPNNKGLAKSFGPNNSTDSAITPWFGPVTSSSALSFITRTATYIGVTAGFRYIPSSNDQFLVLGASENDSTNYTLVKDLFSVYQGAQGTNFVTVNESLSTFAGQRMKLKFKSRCTNNDLPFQDIDNVEVTSVTSVKYPQQITEGFQISPNPGNGLFQIQIAKEKSRTYKLFNALGSLVAEGQLIPNQETLDFRAQHKGIYFLRIGETTRRIVIR